MAAMAAVVAVANGSAGKGDVSVAIGAAAQASVNRGDGDGNGDSRVLEGLCHRDGGGGGNDANSQNRFHAAAGTAADREGDATSARLADETDDDFADLDGLEFWRVEGCDLQGRQIIRIVSNLLPAFALCKTRLRSYILRQANLLLERLPPDQQMCIVHLNADATWERNSPGVMWLRSLYEDLPRAFRQRVGKVYLVHPGAALWGSLLLLGPWLSEGLYSKTVYISRLEFLAEHIDLSEDSDELSIPDFVWSHDNDLEHHPLMDYGLQLDPVAARVHMPESMSDTCTDGGASEP